jgi:UDP:flavonoid glycosyltransferase YjiC (YdhE family)
MWGETLLPQTKIIPLVDLVITHSGNNTVCETFYFGKPMIALPVFGDQYDIAQRIDDLGFGLRLDPYFCTENDLLKAIEKLLHNVKFVKLFSLFEFIMNAYFFSLVSTIKKYITA